MNICSNCRKPVRLKDAVVDHKLPAHRLGSQDLENVRLMHKTCLAKPKWYKRLWWFITDIYDGIINGR